MSVLSFLIQAVNSVRSRIIMAYLVGFLLVPGPFDHVIGTAIHVFFGLLFDAPMGYGEMSETIVIATAGTLSVELASLRLPTSPR